MEQHTPVKDYLIPYSDALLLDTLLHHPELYYSETLQTLEMDGIFFAQDSQIQLIILSVDEDSISADTGKGNEDETRNDLYNRLAEMLGRYIGKRFHAYMTMAEGMLLCILSYNHIAAFDPERLREIASSTIAEARDVLGAPACIHIGRTASGPSQLSACYASLQSLIRHTKFMSLKGSIFFESDFREVTFIHAEMISQLAEAADQIMACVCGGMDQEAQAYLRKALASITAGVFFYKECLYAFFVIFAEMLFMRLDHCKLRPVTDGENELLLKKLSVSGTFSEAIELFVSMIQSISAARNRRDPKDDMIAHVEQFIAVNISNINLDVSVIAEQFHISQSTLSSRFKRIKGIPISEYLCVRRIDHAKKLLSGTTLTIEQIAMQSGFGSVATLFRAFHRFEKITPGVYRKMYARI